MEHYNSNIQLDKNVIDDIFKITENTENAKMLVFGLGHDSKMWYNNNPNTYFVEDKDEYINLNKNDIPSDNIIKYSYMNINVKNSFNMTDDTINKYTIPQKLLDLMPFDIILIDGPEGYADDKCGRLIPYYWSSKLCKEGSIVYCDDIKRPLEWYCMNKFFTDKNITFFSNRLGCMKIYI